MFDPSWATLDLGLIAARLAAVRQPDGLFGPLDGAPTAQLARIHGIYRQLALLVHPDRHGNDPRATSAFAAVQRLYELARQQILSDYPGSPASGRPATTIWSRRRAYTIDAILAQGEIAVLYTATATNTTATAPTATTPTVRPVVLKVARDSQDDDLIANEASALRLLLRADGGAPVPPYIPRLLETFVCYDSSGIARAASAFPPVTTAAGTLAPRDFYTLGELRAAYPDGLDPRHMAWIWRRLLIALGHAHARGVVHGAVLPEHVLIHPADHGLLLVDWCASVQLGRSPNARITVISPEYASWYPAEVLAGRTPTSTIDLTMALRCMAYLLGGDSLTGTLPAHTPGPLQAYLHGALATTRAGRADAPRLYQDFSRLLASLWGRRRFVPLPMPARSVHADPTPAGART